MTYTEAVEAVKADIIEAATEMGLDVDWYKSEILNEKYFDEVGKVLLSVEINEKMNKINA
jgi:hypothetical protein